MRTVPALCLSAALSAWACSPSPGTPDGGEHGPTVDGDVGAPDAAAPDAGTAEDGGSVTPDGSIDPADGGGDVADAATDAGPADFETLYVPSESTDVRALAEARMARNESTCTGNFGVLQREGGDYPGLTTYGSFRMREEASTCSATYVEQCAYIACSDVDSGERFWPGGVVIEADAIGGNYIGPTATGGTSSSEAFPEAGTRVAVELYEVEDDFPYSRGERLFTFGFDLPSTVWSIVEPADSSYEWTRGEDLHVQWEYRDEAPVPDLPVVLSFNPNTTDDGVREETICVTSAPATEMTVPSEVLDLRESSLTGVRVRAGAVAFANAFGCPSSFAIYHYPTGEAPTADL